MTKNKIKQLSGLKRLLSKNASRQEKIVFTNGCFDILHLGHITYLERARALGDKLIVAINSDASVKKIKGKNRPIFPQQERAALIAACQYVDYVIIFKEDTPLKLIKLIRPQVLVKGGDWQKDNIVGADFVKSYAGKVVTIPFVKGYSTSSIIARIKKQ